MALNRNTTRALQRQIDLTTAVCQERLLASHVRHVLAFVELVSPDVQFDSALDIYSRILRLSPEQARNVGSRALAALGRQRGMPDTGVDPEIELMEDDAGDREDAHVSPGDHSGRFDAIFGRVRRRIRGRVHDQLRDRINLAGARAEDSLFNTHVDNALIFSRALADEVPLHEAVDLYLEIMVVPEGVSDVIFNRALRTVADDVLPPVVPPRATPSTPAASPAQQTLV
ncbi:MAG TPA: hypothetical protein VE913_05040 [Longimicrobium sp.]|nr:hypothetical protein [Longimicrobium sp.]